MAPFNWIRQFVNSYIKTIHQYTRCLENGSTFGQYHRQERLTLFHHEDIIKWKHFPRYWPFVHGNSPVTGEFPPQRPVTQRFDVFFDLCQNVQLSKQSYDWWFEMPLCPLWYHGTADYQSLITRSDSQCYHSGASKLLFYYYRLEDKVTCIAVSVTTFFYYYILGDKVTFMAVSVHCCDTISATDNIWCKTLLGLLAPNDIQPIKQTYNGICCQLKQHITQKGTKMHHGMDSLLILWCLISHSHNCTDRIHDYDSQIRHICCVFCCCVYIVLFRWMHTIYLPRFGFASLVLGKWYDYPSASETCPW